MTGRDANLAASASCLCKDTHDLVLKFRKFHGEHHAARMEDQIEAGRQQIDVTAQRFAHAPLDAIAFMSLAHDFARGESDARAMGQ